MKKEKILPRNYNWQLIKPAKIISTPAPLYYRYCSVLLTKEILLKRGFRLSPNATFHYCLDNIDHTTVCFYSWGHMIIYVRGKYLKGDNLTVEEYEKFYRKVTGEELRLIAS